MNSENTNLGLSRSLSLALSDLSLSRRLSVFRLGYDVGFVVRMGDRGCGVRGETDLENDLDREEDLKRFKIGICHGQFFINKRTDRHMKKLTSSC